MMTVGALVFSTDSRVGITVTPAITFGDMVTWQLEVANVTVRDSGQYMCQVNTDNNRGVTMVMEVLGEQFSFKNICN